MAEGEPGIDPALRQVQAILPLVTLKEAESALFRTGGAADRAISLLLDEEQGKKDALLAAALQAAPPTPTMVDEGDIVVIHTTPPASTTPEPEEEKLPMAEVPIMEIPPLVKRGDPLISLQPGQAGDMTVNPQWQVYIEEEQRRHAKEDADYAAALELQEEEKQRMTELAKEDAASLMFARQLLDAEEREIKEEKRKEAEATEAMLEKERAERQAELERKTYPCAICMEDCTIDEIYIIDACNHKFCLDCFRQHVSTKVEDGPDACRDIKCPDPTCGAAVTFQEVKGISTPSIFQRYERFLLQSALANDPNCRWCPRPGCGNAMIGNPALPMMVCSSAKCRFTFCFNCREEWHADTTCEQYQRWKVENAQGEDRFEAWARDHTKACPKCHAKIEKNGGCNHMTCKNCRHEFCWLCLGDYGRNHFRAGGCRQFS